MCTVELITTMMWMQLKNDVITTTRESHVTYHTYDKNHPVSVNEEKKKILLSTNVLYVNYPKHCTGRHIHS